MHRYCKVLLGSAAAVALVSGVVMLTTSQASAQINIEGLIRGAMHSYYGGGGYSRHHRGRVHESSRHERGSREEAKDDDDKGGSKDKQDHQTADKDSSDRGSSDKGSSAVPAANTAPPKQQPVADVPNLTPER